MRSFIGSRWFLRNSPGASRRWGLFVDVLLGDDIGCGAGPVQCVWRKSSRNAYFVKEPGLGDVFIRERARRPQKPMKKNDSPQELTKIAKLRVKTISARMKLEAGVDSFYRRLASD